VLNLCKTSAFLKKRKIKAVVISDVHLGTFGCRAKELSNYLSSIEPEILILNGDIVDIWQFSKRYWPKSHMQIIKQITEMIADGVTVYYVTGNHDEMLRKFTGFEISNFSIVNKVMLTLDGKKCRIFHGDVFDVTMKHSKWLAKLGAIGYDTLIYINSFVNFLSQKAGRGKISLSKKIKNSVKTAVAFINNFEQTAAEIAIEKGYDYVICGHIHQPANRIISTAKGSVTYLNSGDWIENLTALEYENGEWTIYHYNEKDVSEGMAFKNTADSRAYLKNTQLFKTLVKEFELLSD
jgi:UDP-2,3-diacylglucosamine pyrophosphatase LpxH